MMPDIKEAVANYKNLVGEVPVAKTADAESKVLKTLLARDRVARELAGYYPPTPEVLSEIAGADHLLKEKAEKINKVVGSSKLVEWREARRQPATLGPGQPQGDEWWWSLDTHAAEGLPLRVLSYILWGVIVVSLSFAIEGLRRFLSGEVGVLGTVLQGLVTLLVGSTLIEFGRQVAAVQAGRKEEKKKALPLRRRLIFTSVVLCAAFVIWFLLPRAVKYYSNLGVGERQEGQLTKPVSLYQRTISLSPSDAIAHYNLARAYEAMADYDKAEDEYKSAIRWGDDQAVFYDGLAHLTLFRKKEPAIALKLLNKGIEELEAQKKAGEFRDEEGGKRIEVSLLRNRAWAYLRLEYLTLAEDDLRAAMELAPDAAAPRCLLGQVLEGEQKSEKKLSKPDDGEVQKVYRDCIALSQGQADKIEPEWLSQAQERLNEADEKESSGAGKSRTQVKGKKQ
jgi:tetratricopeptide (TPR) repeat protein